MRNQFGRVGSAILVSAFLAGVVVAGADLKSGLQVGDAAGPFEVRDITGPNKGKTLCYR